MGIRPGMSLVCGIDNLQATEREITDPRFQPTMWWDVGWERKIELPKLQPASGYIPVWLSENQACVHINGKRPRELLYYDSEYYFPNIIGYTIDSPDYSGDVLWAMASAFDLQENKYFIMPSIPLKEDISGPAYYLRTLIDMSTRIHSLSIGDFRQRGTEEANKNNRKAVGQASMKNHLVRRSWNYSNGLGMYMFGWVAITHKLFNILGFHIDPKDMKLMLCWKWS